MQRNIEPSGYPTPLFDSGYFSAVVLLLFQCLPGAFKLRKSACLHDGWLWGELSLVKSVLNYHWLQMHISVLD